MLNNVNVQPLHIIPPTSFTPASVEDVRQLVMCSPNKSCHRYQLPIILLIACGGNSKITLFGLSTVFFNHTILLRSRLDEIFQLMDESGFKLHADKTECPIIGT